MHIRKQVRIFFQKKMRTAIVWAALSERTFEEGPTKWEVSSKVVIFFEMCKYISKKVREGSYIDRNIIHESTSGSIGLNYSDSSLTTGGT